MSKIITVFLAGLVVGLLLSEDTRTTILDTLSDAQDKLKDKAHEGLDKAEGLVGSLESKLRKAIS